MSARDELAKVIYTSHRGNTQVDLLDNRRLQGSQLAWANLAAATLIAAGYRKPKVLGYVVVSRDGTPIGAQFSDRATAQARADEWTNDCKTGGVDWDYRVAEIVEAAA